MLTLENKKTIYRLIKSQLHFGVIAMNDVAQLLTDHRVTASSYGYSKLKQLLQDVPEFIDILGSGDQRNPIRFKEWDEKKEQPKAPAREPLIAMPKAAPKAVVEPSLTPESLLEVTRLEPQVMAVLEDKAAKSPRALPAFLEASYQQALATKRIEITQDRIRFPMAITGKKDTPLIVTFKRVPSDAEGRYLSFQYVDDSGLPLQLIQLNGSQNPARALERFAFLGRWEDFLITLAGIAKREDWNFCDYYPPNNYILKKYIQYTFFRLLYENKVEISADGRLAAFNTGLVNEQFEDIYACFVPNNGGSSPWLFKEFVIAGQRGLGKELVEYFSPLPQPATYFTRKEDLLYDLDKKLHCDDEHIIIENIDRFHIEFLKNQFRDVPEAMEILKQIRGHAPIDERRPHYDALIALFHEQPALYARLKNRLDEAIQLAFKQVRWNYKSAVPSYYPSRNTMNLMLPLNLTSPEYVDNVLVCELTSAGNYQGQTILTLEQAYIDARLVCSPQANWLSTSSIVGCYLQDD